MTPYISNFDIACFSETKINNIPKNEFPDFEIFSLKQKTKLHGLACFVKTGLFPHVKQIQSHSKCVLWLSFGLSAEKIIFLIGVVYIPGEGSKYADPEDHNIISECIGSMYAKYACPILLLGDFNSRTGGKNDINPEKCSKSHLEQFGLSFERKSCDSKIDKYGRNLIDLCSDLNFHILNGRYGGDKNIGNFTCLKTIGQSIVDYAVISSSSLPLLSNFYIVYANSTQIR